LPGKISLEEGAGRKPRFSQGLPKKFFRNSGIGRSKTYIRSKNPSLNMPGLRPILVSIAPASRVANGKKSEQNQRCPETEKISCEGHSLGNWLD
jgi:hypothetical protein